MVNRGARAHFRMASGTDEDSRVSRQFGDVAAGIKNAGLLGAALLSTACNSQYGYPCRGTIK